MWEGYLKILHFHPEVRNVPASENLPFSSVVSLLSLTVISSYKLCIVNPVVGWSLVPKIAHTKKV